MQCLGYTKKLYGVYLEFGYLGILHFVWQLYFSHLVLFIFSLTATILD